MTSSREYYTYACFVLSVDFPTDLLSILQEKGRCGRYEGAEGKDNRYIALGDLSDIEYMLIRILKFNGYSADSKRSEAYDIFNKLISLEEFKVQQLENYHSVLDFFVLPKQCQHITLEENLCNPYTKENGYTASSCKNFCQYCINNGIHPKFPKIILNGAKTVLSNLFIGENALLQPGLTTDLVDGLLKYPNIPAVLFGSRRKKPEKCDITRFIMMLLTAKLIGYKLIEKNSNQMVADSDTTKKTELVTFLNKDDNNIPLIFNDIYWERIPHK